MIDLCIDARMAFSSGIGTYIRHLVPFFAHLRVILLVDRLDAPWCKGFEQILFPAPIYSLKEQMRFPFMIPKCDLFWSPHYNAPLSPIRAKKRVVTIHDACHLAFGTFSQKIYAKKMMQNALSKAQKAITVSHFSKQEIQKYLGPNHLEVISIGVNRSHFYRKPASEELRKKYRLPEKFALFVGNTKAHKNSAGLKAAFAKIDLPNFGLVMVGAGTDVGAVSDEELPILYSMAEMLVFPSFYEGFGLPPLEAMSCGCPTVVSKAASMPEVCGDSSVYFYPDDEEQIAKMIVQVATNPELKQAIIQKGLQRVEAFSWERAAEKHIQVFEEALHA